jgi:hypothetical protein
MGRDCYSALGGDLSRHFDRTKARQRLLLRWPTLTQRRRRPPRSAPFGRALPRCGAALPSLPPLWSCSPFSPAAVELLSLLSRRFGASLPSLPPLRSFSPFSPAAAELLSLLSRRCGASLPSLPPLRSFSPFSPAAAELVLSLLSRRGALPPTRAPCLRASLIQSVKADYIARVLKKPDNYRGQVPRYYDPHRATPAGSVPELYPSPSSPATRQAGPSCRGTHTL